MKNLTLSHFRNYSSAFFSFSPKTTLLAGPNTVGKTNILEAVVLLSGLGSFRGGLDREMIRWGSQIGRVKGQVESTIGELMNLEVILTLSSKKYLLNGVAKRQADFAGNLKCVLFSPWDLNLITGSPFERRKYLDNALSVVNKEYRYASLEYEKSLKQRNRLLFLIAERKADSRQLFYWNENLIKNGKIIAAGRQVFFDFLNRFQLPESGNGKMDFLVFYKKNEISREKFIEYAKKEILLGATLIGPHRDDFIIKTKKEEKEIGVFGSRGEQRLAVIWLKMGELAFIKSVTKDTPVLLLDEIFAELDHLNRQFVLEVIGNQQTIITTTDLHLIEERHLEGMKIITLPLDKSKVI